MILFVLLWRTASFIVIAIIVVKIIRGPGRKWSNYNLKCTFPHFYCSVVLFWIHFDLPGSTGNIYPLRFAKEGQSWARAFTCFYIHQKSRNEYLHKLNIRSWRNVLPSKTLEINIFPCFIICTFHVYEMGYHELILSFYDEVSFLQSQQCLEVKE